ncbi:MAG: VWA domain-containing protein [Methylophilus sp.]|nr:VWA domain-containing protein [Methylophilus sp.]
MGLTIQPLKDWSWRKALVHIRRWLHQSWRNGSLCLIIAAIILLPVWFTPTTQMQSLVQDTLFVIDISESMNVQDVDYPRPHTSRLHLAKEVVRESMASLPCGSRVSIALFAGDESIVLFEPLEVCRHFSAIEQVVARLQTKMRWVGDSWVVRALVMSIKEAHKRQLNVVMVTDGDEMPHHSAPRLTDLLSLKDKAKGLLVGVGGQALQPVPKLNDQQQIVGYWTPEEAVMEGNHPNLLAYVKALQPGERAAAGALDEVGEHLSALNKPLLKAVAEASKFDFVHIQQPQQAVSALNNADLQKTSLAERDASWLFALASILLFLIAWFWHRIFSQA